MKYDEEKQTRENLKDSVELELLKVEYDKDGNEVYTGYTDPEELKKKCDASKGYKLPLSEKAAGIMGYIMVIAICLLIVWAVRNSNDHEHCIAYVTVVDKESDWHHRKDKPDYTSYYITVQYDTEETTNKTVKVLTTSGTYNKVEIGKKYYFVYLYSDGIESMQLPYSTLIDN